MKNIFKATWRVLRLLIVLLVVALGLWQLEPVKKWTRDGLQRTVLSQTGWHMTAADLSLAWPLAVKGSDIRLENPEGWQISIETLYCQPSWYSFLRGALTLHSLELEGIDIKVPEGCPKEPKEAKANPSSTALQWPPSLLIEHFAIRQVHCQQLAWPRTLGLMPLCLLQGSVKVDKDAQQADIQLQIKAGKALKADLELHVQRQLDTDALRLDFACYGADGVLKIPGWRLPIPGGWQLEGHAYGPPASWVALLRAEPACQGAIHGKARWQTPDHSGPHSTLHFKWDKRLHLSWHLATILPARMHLNGDLDSDIATGYSQASWQIEGDMSPLKLPWHILPGKMSLQGRWKGSFVDNDWQLTYNATDWGYRDHRADNLHLHIDGHGDATAWQGLLQAQGHTSAGEYNASSHLHYDTGTERLQLQDINLYSALIALEGNLSLSPSLLNTLEGYLSVHTHEEQISLPFLPAISLPMPASADLTLQPTSQGHQAATFTFAIPKLHSSHYQLEEALGSLTTEDLFGSCQIKADIDIAAMHWQDQPLGHIAATTTLMPHQKWPYHILSTGHAPMPWQLTAQGVWRLNDEQLFVTLEQLDGHIAAMPMQLLEPCQLRLESDAASLSALRCKTGDTKLTAHFHDEEQAYSLHLHYGPLAASSLQNLLSIPTPLTPSSAPWNVDASFHIDKELTDAILSVTAAPQKATEQTNLTVRAIRQPETLQINAHLFHPSQDGILPLFGTHQPPITGNVYFNGHFDTTQKNLSGALDLEGTTNHLPVHVNAKLSVNNDVWKLKDCQGSLADNPFQGSLTLTPAQQQIEADIIGQLNPASFGLQTTWLPEPLDASIHITGAWYTPRISWHIAATNPWPVEFQGRGKLEADIFSGYFQATSPLATTKARFSFDTQQQTLAIQELSAIGSQGEARAQIQATTSEITLSLQSARLNLNGAPLQLDHPSQLTWQPGKLELAPLQINLGQGKLVIHGLGDHEHFSIKLDGDNIPLADLIKDLNQPLSAKVALKGVLEGPWHKPEGTLHLDLSDLAVTDPLFDKSPSCKATGDLTLKGDKAELNGQLQCPGLEPISFHAAVPMTISVIPWRITLDKTAPLYVDAQAAGAIAPFLDLFITDATNAAGRLAATIHIRGTLQEPLIQGQLSLQEGFYETLHTGTILRDITLKAKAEGREIKIEQLRGKDNRGGSFHAQGSVALQPDKGFPFTLQCQLERLLLLNLDHAHASVAGTVNIQGNNQGATLAGNLDLLAPRIVLPEDLSSSVETVEVDYANIPKGRTPLLARQNKPIAMRYPLNLNLNIKTGSQLHIDSRVLSSSWQGQMHIGGTLATPLLQGEMQIQQGSYLYSGKSFQLNQGTIHFSGPWEKTTLYIIAKQEIDSVVVEVILRGPLKNPSLAFRSNPAMSQQEILSYLLFGKGLSEITPYQGNQLSRSISNLTEGSSTPNLLEKLRRALPIPIDLGIGRNPTKEGDKVSVQVGLSLTPDLYLSLNRNVTDESHSIALEAKLIENVKARVETNSDSETQLFLKWKHDF